MRLGIAIAALALAGLTGCGGDEGGDGSIPPNNAQSLLDQLDGIRSAIDDGDCTKAQTDAAQFVVSVNALPEEAGVEVKEQLREAGQNLDELVASECEDTGVTGETGPVEETTTTEAPVVPVEPVEEAPEEETDDEGPPAQPPGEGDPGGGSGSGEDDSGGVGEGKQKKPKKHGSGKGSG